MMDEAPHKLYIRTLVQGETDEYGRQVSEDSESWKPFADCFCHDNSQAREITVNGQLWTYSYHIVYEGDKIPLGTYVRCMDGSRVVGEGKVVKNAECYSRDLEGRCDIWV